MKKFVPGYVRVLIFIFVAVLFVGCGSSAAPETVADNRISVVSTIFPGYDFTREIGESAVQLKMLLPPGSESHSFEPTPQDIIAIQNCDLFIYVGGESDTWVENILDSMDTSAMTILSMMDIVDVVEEEIKEGMEDDHDDEDDDPDDDSHTEEGEYDEHVWTSPVNAKKIAEAIAQALCNLDEENAPLYKENMEQYAAKLEALDSSFRAVMANAARDTLIFGDRFPFRYLVDEYGLDYYAAFPGCSTETEASAKTVAFLIDKVNSEQIPVVFHIEFSNEKMADTICEATGAEKRILHSCHNVMKDDFEKGVSYLELMEKNVLNLKEAVS